MPLTLSGNGTISDLASAPTVGGTALPTNLSDLGIANHDQITVDSSGRMNVTQPFIKLQGNSGTRVINQGDNVPYTYWDTVVSRGITFNSSNGQITFPVDGRYLVSAKFYMWMDNASGHSLVVRFNGANLQEYPTDYASVGTGGNTDHVKTVSEILEVSANDYIDFMIYADIYGGPVQTNCQVTMIG